MKRAELLQRLEIGKSVAEFDRDLERYFVATADFSDFVAERYEIVAGDKGTGKSAIFRFLSEHRRDFEELRNVEVLPAFNIAGVPVFYELTRSAVLTEGEYNSLWKAYILSVIGNYLLNVLGDDEVSDVAEILDLAGLKVGDYRPESVFQRLKTTFQAFLRPKEVSGSVSLLDSGLPVVSGKVVPDYGEQTDAGAVIPYDYALNRLEAALDELNLTVWVAFDRLDEAFQGAPEHEVPALRALLRVYLDLAHLSRVKVKLFLRNDLFTRITTEAFVNLSHINDQRRILEWSEESLLDLICRRVADNAEVMEKLEIDPTSLTDEESRLLLLYRVFPSQVDAGSRRPTTWNWILSRIRDGQDVRPPRNLINLVEFARANQLREDERDKREWEDPPLVESNALRRGLERLSAARVEDTLQAEYANLRPFFDAFRGGKAEHNRESLEEQLGATGDELTKAIEALVAAGFLERTGDTWKIPMLYRGGLEITQGKAFAPEEEVDEDEEV
jgi:hypothetical protein